jgi:Sortase domain
MAEPDVDPAAVPARKSRSMDRTTFLAVTVATACAQIGVAAMVIGLGFGRQSAPVPSMEPTLSQSHHDADDPLDLTDSLFPSAPPTPAVAPMALTLDRSMPVHLSIPRVGIETDLLSLGLNQDGTLQLPPDSPNSPAGWYQNLASPGEVGPAVIVGHLDAPDAQAVFFNLGALHPGDHIWVTRADSSIAEFTVRESGLYPKESFPSEAVYGPSSLPVLRLITCGGAYSPSGYTQNVVVFAALTGIATEPERQALQTGDAQ